MRFMKSEFDTWRIIHMQLAEENIPFDVSLYRAIKYSRARPRDLRTAQENLRAQVQAAIVDGYQVENPVTRTRGIVQIGQHATPENKLLLEQLQIMRHRLDRIEQVAEDRSSSALEARYRSVRVQREEGLFRVKFEGEFIAIEQTILSILDMSLDISPILQTGPSSLEMRVSGPKESVRSFYDRIRQLPNVIDVGLISLSHKP